MTNCQSRDAMPYDDGTTHPHTVQEGKKKIRRSCGARVQARVRNMAGINEFVHEKKGNAFSSSFDLVKI